MSLLQRLFAASRRVAANALRLGACAPFLFCALPASTATLLPGFTETPVATGILSPTAMEFAPDGRIFVTEQGGAVRVIKNGSLLATPFASVTVNSDGERGLLGVTFDPNFATNNYVYVYYTATTPAIHNRVSRFTANGDVAAAGSEVVILELNDLSGATNHNGGPIHFGLDGKLYIGVGENANGANSQTLTNLLGKMLRINADGTIPSDNPFSSSATGNNRAIWAWGLRNPYTFAVQPGTGRIFINDVGQNTWEEINDGIAGANYGWPNSEGLTSTPGQTSPLYAYPHSGGPVNGCSIIGGAFYNPPSPQFPVIYTGQYFFSDYCSGWIKVYDPVANSVAGFATGVNHPADLKTGPNGSLYYLARGSGGNTGVVYEIKVNLAIVSVASRKQHGVAGTFDLPLAATPLNPTTETRSTGDGNFSLTFTFTKPLISGDAVVTEGVAVAGATVVNGNELIVPLSGVANAQYVTVNVGNVTSTTGDTGGSASARVGFLFGDVNQGRQVTVADIGIVNASLLQPVTSANYMLDVNADGNLTVADKGLVNANALKKLPAP
jgi:glucose/arabinose dehydrogenase